MKKILFLISLLLSVFIGQYSFAQWQQTNGPYGGTISSLATDGINIYAGTLRQGIFKSTDDGVTWEDINNGLNIQDIYAIAVNTDNVFIGTDGGVFLSKDFGNSWKNVSNGYGFSKINSIAINGENIFVGTEGGGVFVSTNNGLIWNVYNNGLTDTFIISLAINGQNIFVGTHYEGKVFLSTDNGINWKAVANGLHQTTITSVLPLYIKGDSILAGTEGYGIYLSTNNGESWSSFGLRIKQIFSIISDRTKIIAGTNDGILISHDNGGKWKKLENRISGGSVLSLCKKNSSIIAGTDGNGMFKSTDNGESWNTVQTNLIYANIESMTTIGDNIFAGSKGGGIYVSTNNGSSWSNEVNGINTKYINTIASTKTRVFTGTNGNNLYISKDYGKNWDSLGLNYYWVVNSISADSSRIVTCGANSFVYVSKDNGESWQGLDCFENNDEAKFVYVKDNYFFASGYPWGLNVSTDFGNTWLSSNQGLPYNTEDESYSVISSMVKIGNVFFAEGYRSNDNAQSWTLNQNFRMRPLLNCGKFGIAGASRDGIYMSVDTGKTWNEKNEGLIKKTVNSLAANNYYLFAGINGKGVWKRALSEMVGIDELGPSTSLRMTELKIYPNPVRDDLVIETNDKSQFNLRISNVYGQSIYYSILNKKNIIDIKNLNSGIYIVEVTNEKGREIRKIIKE